ncbi:MAG: helix-turn-helix transcriptional regulator [Thermomicrobiales bacterium]|nr:helix-turn-helix transcriptional regulator [Thermomicrobiales bacterium]
MTFGDRVREARNRRGLTQSEVARRARVSSAYLCDIEKSRRDCPLKTAEAIADAIGCPIAEIDPVVSGLLSWVKPNCKHLVW